MIESITLLGSSSGRNAGDAALIAGIMDSVDDACKAKLLYEIPTIRPSFIRNNYHNRTQPIGMLPWNLSLKMFGFPTYSSLLRTDLSLIFDAILFDRSLYNPLFNYMSTLSLLLPRIKRRGKKMGFYNVGTGPVDSAHGQRMLREISEMMDFITVRDESSLKLLKDIGVQNPNMAIAADAALTVVPSDEERVNSILLSLGLTPGQEIMGININAYLDTWVRPKRPSMGKEAFLKIYSQALIRFWKETGVPLLFVCTQHHDVPVTKELMELIPDRCNKTLLSNVTYNHYDIKGVLGKLSLLFGMRLHANILSASALTPTIGLAYQPKVAYFFSTLRMPELSVSFDHFTEEGLYNAIASAWSQRKAIRERLEQRIPELQREALLPARMIGAIHRGEKFQDLFSENKTSSHHDIPSAKVV